MAYILLPTPLHLLILALVGGLTVACGSSDSSTPTATLPPLVLPADEAPHDFQTEWWYWNLHLQPSSVLRTGLPDDPRFFLHYAVFQVQEQESRRTLYVAQIGVADAETGSFASAERIVAQPQPLDTFAFTFGNWIMAAEAARGRYEIKGGAGEITFDLRLQSASTPILHDGNGLVDFGASGISYYYSRPRLEVMGSVVVAGESFDVRGVAWLDKQWGDFVPVTISWDWTGIQLESGIDLMLTRVLGADGQPVAVYGTLGKGDQASIRHLREEDFTFEPEPASIWVSPATGASYPTRWKVTIPEEEIDIILRPQVRESEFVSNGLGVIYWEAGMHVEGTHEGLAFVELTGRVPVYKGQ